MDSHTDLRELCSKLERCLRTTDKLGLLIASASIAQALDLLATEQTNALRSVESPWQVERTDAKRNGHAE